MKKVLSTTVIIPSYGRTSEVLKETISKLFGQFGLNEHLVEVFLLDQNHSPRDVKNVVSQDQRFQYIQHHHFNSWTFDQRPTDQTIPFFHIVSLNPSVTISKNYAVKKARGELIIFLDDDASMKPEAFKEHIKFHQVTANVGVVGGREIVVPKSKGRSFLKKIVIFFPEILKNLLTRGEESQYMLHGKYCGRITKNGYFYCNYDLEGSHAVKVNTVRGCNCSVKRNLIEQAGFFDETFQGTALREESDLCLRIEALGKTNYYLPTSVVKHRRQLGGCNNLAKSYQTFISHLENEKYFHQKHFSHRPTVHFLFRLLPMTLESIRFSFGIGFLLLLQFTLTIAKEKLFSSGPIPIQRPDN